jgi:hypothetical protein
MADAPPLYHLSSSPTPEPAEHLGHLAHSSGFPTPQSQGWFNLHMTEVQQALASLSRQKLDRDGLYNMVFEVDHSRPLYEGDRPQELEALLQEEEQDDDDALTGKEKKLSHSEVEKRRRSRHQVWQVKSHRMCPEQAHRLINEDRVYKKANRTKSSSKKPGKDEQFCASIYAMAMCGIVLQSEHQGRKLAEERALIAEKRLAQLEHGMRKRKLEDSDDEPLSSLAKRIRPVLQPVPRLPLSPSPTPTCSTSSHWSH